MLLTHLVAITYTSPITAPLQGAIKYKEVIFTDGFTQLSKYQGPPSPTLDKTWLDLYTHLTRIPEAEAALLTNKTTPIPGDPGYYGIIIDVFHSMHCLDELRKSAWPEYYGSFASRYHVSEEVGAMHVGG